MKLFNNQQTIGKNLLAFLRLKGYTKSSFAKMVEISRPTLNQIFEGNSPNPNTYKEQIKKITDALNVPIEFFLETALDTAEKWQTPTTQYSDHAFSSPERSKEAQSLLNDLDELLTVAAIYIKE
ncbi:helix-turn-helix transcriptional regulator [Ureibacillus chungkukjangi]|uniref:helix-turn-helix domain-containing protein n=1 Tax=Ureibacillus chungkukjangi TaxID=1202712 RepID=UPI002041AEF7|nr:helix-turn-helix transcriptional regulator [Ureibacillus chungkukjangi]MCM3390449.1 helix-turn-helix transcriptional regulator [Ureibacillus chungkukjangi]